MERLLRYSFELAKYKPSVAYELTNNVIDNATDTHIRIYWYYYYYVEMSPRSIRNYFIHHIGDYLLLK